MKWADVVRLGLELPSVEESRWYGTPALKVGGKGFVRLKEDGETIVLGVETVDAKQFLISALPDVYFITPHYEGYPAVLVRLKALRISALESPTCVSRRLITRLSR